MESKKDLVSLLKALQGIDEESISDLFSHIESIRNKKSTSVQIREIIPVDKWLESEYYVGMDGMKLYDYWKQVIFDIHNSKVPINEVVITGSLGIGKTTLAVFLMLRKMYEMSCFTNIPLLFPNMMANSNIVFTYFMMTKKQAESTGFRQFREVVDSIPYFRSDFPRNFDINSRLEWPKQHLMFIYGSSSDDFIGMNAIGSILDEANFFKVGAGGASMQPDYTKVFSLYESITNRSKSRFRSHGRDSSLSILVSSPTTESSFTQTRIEASANDPSTYVISAKPWEVKPKGTYSDIYFWIFTGSDNIDPCVINSIEDINRICEGFGADKFSEYVELDYAVSKLPTFITSSMMKVPYDFKKNFEVNILRSMQDIAGVSITPVGRLFTSKPIYNKRIVETLRHPFTRDVFSVSTGDELRIHDYLIPGFRFIDPEKPHFIHVDQSTTSDCTGFGLCHIERVENINGSPKPIIQTDIMLRITPPAPPRKISIAKVRDFIFYLRDYLGVNIAKVTYDRFASADSIQILNEGGFETDFLSVDRNDKPYMALVNLFYEDQIELYSYEPFENEFFSLIHYRDQGKVDHPSNNAKDTSDAICGAVYNALQFDLSKSYSLMDSYENSFLSSLSSQEDDESFMTLKDVASNYYDKRIFNVQQKFKLY